MRYKGDSGTRAVTEQNEDRVVTSEVAWCCCYSEPSTKTAHGKLTFQEDVISVFGAGDSGQDGSQVS